jgi:hypothetical protein
MLLLLQYFYFLFLFLFCLKTSPCAWGYLLVLAFVFLIFICGFIF